jgi:hypothetical protein
VDHAPDLGGIPCQHGMFVARDLAVGACAALHLVVLMHLVADPGCFAGADSGFRLGPDRDRAGGNCAGRARIRHRGASQAEGQQHAGQNCA